MRPRAGLRQGPHCAALLIVGLAAAGCGTAIAPFTPPPGDAGFVVTNTAGFPVIGATVFLVPAGDIDGSPITAGQIRSGASEDRDEPLEDAVRLRGTTYPKAVTDARGIAVIPRPPMGRYFAFVRPAPTDVEHVPGGSACRLALDDTVYTSGVTAITMSSQPGPGATYVGSSRCLDCHGNKGLFSTHAHKLGFAEPGRLGGLQDNSRYPDYEDGWNRFLPAAAHTGGTVLYLSGYDPSRGFDKFKASLSDPTGLGETVFVRAWLWQDTADGTYKITLVNAVNGADPRSPWTLEVGLTYGGAVYKQRNLVRVAGRKGLYPLLQYQTEGHDGRYDRTRRVYRDYHLDWFWDAGPMLFKDPPLDRNFEANCTACHSTGFVRYQDPGTSEWLSHAVDDPGGAYDIDGDGNRDEINLGCEVCHGPGSEHVAWRPPAGSGLGKARYIVTLRNMSPSREMMVCGRCHGREKGNGTISNDEPLNATNEMLRVGMSRHEYLTAGYVQRKGPAASHMWNDGLHSKSHHQQYSDLLKSTKHRNGRILVTCTDCHDSHGTSPYKHHLKADPTDSKSGLCSQCHFYDLTQHMLAKTGSTHAGNSTHCFLCHMPNAAKSGAGVFGKLISPPTGGPGDEDVVYYTNDISSHLFLRVPMKTHPDVAGETPSFAMPVAYTNACGSCHNAAQIPFLKPGAPVAGKPQQARKGHDPDNYGSD